MEGVNGEKRGYICNLLNNKDTFLKKNLEGFDTVLVIGLRKK